ncbi:MAG: response regulator [Bdellovibrionales bacterium]|nr:response regulator [Bdellovibrionales bacterium]
MKTELQAALAELESLKLKTRLAVHALNGSLTVIAGRAALSRRAFAPGSDQALYMDQIIEAAKEAANVVAHLADRPPPFALTRVSVPLGVDEPSIEAAVLVVDNDRYCVSSVADILSGEGITAFAFTEPEEALTFIRESSCDIVISDINMPSMSGPEMVRRMLEINPSLKLILTSGEEPDPDQVHGLEFSFLPKPFSSLDIVSCIRKILGSNEKNKCSDVGNGSQESVP